MTEDTSELQLTARELKLALKYGYPFPEQEEQLRNSQVINGMHVAHSIRIGSPCGSPTLSARPRRSVAKACSRNSTRSAMYWRPPSSRTLAYAVWFWSSLTLYPTYTDYKLIHPPLPAEWSVRKRPSPYANRTGR